MKKITFTITILALLAVPGFSTAQLERGTACPPDSVSVGPTCVDKFEASMWSIPATAPGGGSNALLVSKVKQGTARLLDLRTGGAVQVGCTTYPYYHAAFPTTFPKSGNWTVPLYATSIRGVFPTACVSWFQAEQACALSGKKLLTNQEWQRAAAGSPEYTLCNTESYVASLTGAKSRCISKWGVFDMVGNQNEWVADWVPRTPGTCPGWGSFSDDLMCFSGADPSSRPAALIRGGSFINEPSAGVFAIVGQTSPDIAISSVGFRCGW